ncbi:hypothetical protein [Cobetia sp. ICG0124]|uniref:hypothetical protein n=1 Tax=Cobetia sp. ICG0124 TaxID=2053669 RepID=UPI001F0B98D3|nr:hypothetical protein [Cobetia sp. ICG0124]
MRPGTRRMLRQQQASALQQPEPQLMVLGRIGHVDATPEHGESRGWRGIGIGFQTQRSIQGPLMRCGIDAQRQATGNAPAPGDQLGGQVMRMRHASGARLAGTDDGQHGLLEQGAPTQGPQRDGRIWQQRQHGRPVGIGGGQQMTPLLWRMPGKIRHHLLMKR